MHHLRKQQTTNRTGIAHCPKSVRDSHKSKMQDVFWYFLIKTATLDSFSVSCELSKGVFHLQGSR